MALTPQDGEPGERGKPGVRGGGAGGAGGKGGHGGGGSRRALIGYALLMAGVILGFYFQYQNSLNNKERSIEGQHASHALCAFTHLLELRIHETQESLKTNPLRVTESQLRDMRTRADTVKVVRYELGKSCPPYKP